MSLLNNQRQWDLLRQMRHSLHQEELITNEEFAQLAFDHPAVARLEDYDAILAKLAEAETRARQAEWTRNLAQAASSRDALEKQRLRAELASAAGLQDYLIRQWDWSKRTFGPGRRTLGILQHLGKELREIEAKPDDLSEWVDVAILAMDGFWRHGGKPEDLGLRI